MKISRRPFTLAALPRVVAVVLLCAAAGLAIGVVVASQTTGARLSRYARHLLEYSENFTEEINTTLDEVNASPFPFCSEQDIDRLRELVFRGHLVKDIGRTKGGSLYCTAMVGKLDQPLIKPRPDITTPSGRSIWLRTPVVAGPGMLADITQSGEADFVAASDAFEHLGELPMMYSTTLTNRVTGQVLRTAGAPLELTNAEILSEQTVLRNGVLYVSRCSTNYAPCMITGIHLDDAWQLNSNLIGGFVIIGGLCGLATAFTMIVQPRKRSLATQLRRALRRNLITVVYQPIVEVKTNRIVGSEALARWTDEEGQYVRPDVFVAAAEELGFIGKLTRVVLKLVIAELGPYLRANPDFRVNINIAAADLADPSFLPMLEKLLARNSIAPSSINLELTERSTANHQLAISAIHRLRERGHAFYIDDFGTGYSSLSYLNELDVDAIKIDRAFTDAIGTGSLTAAIVPQILAMAEKLKVKVIVEGVERAEQSRYFADLEMEILAQGWHFGEAIPVKDLLTLLESREAESHYAVESPSSIESEPLS